MISRRRFVGCGSAAAVWAATSARFAMANPLGLPLGIQLYSVRQQLQQDYDKTLAEVASSGYTEVEAAGFVLDAESTMLANEDDQHSIKVFDPSIKGQTDRFAYRFVKP